MNQTKPAWWQLYLLGAVAVALIVLVHQWNVSESLQGTARIAIVLTSYGALNMWLALNGPALERAQEAREARREGRAPAASTQQAYYRQVFRLRHAQTALRVHTETARREPR